MYPFILKLVEIFKTKDKIFEELKGLVFEIRKIVNEPASVYTEEEQEVILKHRPFHEDTGLLPSVTSLMNLNNLLVNYQDDEDNVSARDEFGINMSKNLAQCGLTVHSAYLQMMSYAEKEQYFLERWFKPTLDEIMNKEDYREAWQKSLSHFGNFLVVLKVDLELFYNLLHLLKERGFLGETVEVINRNRAIIKNNVIVSIKANDFAHARYWINYGKNKEWFREEEKELLDNLVFFIEQQDASQLEQVVESEIFKKIFNKDEQEFFQGILGKIKEGVDKQIPSGPTQLAQRLGEEERLLRIEREVLEEMRAEERGDIDPQVAQILSQETERVDDAVVALQIAYSDVKGPQLLKLKKPGLRLKARFRLLRRKTKKDFRNKREAIENGLNVLKESVRVRQKIGEYLKSIRLKRKAMEKDTKNVGKPSGISRRKFLALGASAGAVAMMGGAEAYFTKGKTAEIQTTAIKTSITPTLPKEHPKLNLATTDKNYPLPIQYARTEEDMFRKKILEAAREQLDLPVEFGYPFINVCTDIIVRAMESAGIYMESNVNKRVSGSVGPWMIKNGCNPKNLNEAKPGVVIFFSGVDADTKKFNKWLHSGIIWDVNEDGTIKSVLMSTSYPFNISKVKIVDFQAWLQYRKDAYDMKINVILDPYELYKKKEFPKYLASKQ